MTIRWVKANGNLYSYSKKGLFKIMECGDIVIRTNLLTKVDEKFTSVADAKRL